MSRIETTFEQLKAQGRKALIPYVTAGFPFADITPALMHGMVEAGADAYRVEMIPRAHWSPTTQDGMKAALTAALRSATGE